MATDNNNPDNGRGKKPAPDALTEALARDPRFVMSKPSGKGFDALRPEDEATASRKAATRASRRMFKAEEPSPRSRQSVRPRASCSTTRSARWWQRWSASLSVL